MIPPVLANVETVRRMRHATESGPESDRAHARRGLDALVELLRPVAAGEVKDPNVSAAEAHALMVEAGSSGDVGQALIAKAFGTSSVNHGIRRPNGGLSSELGSMSQREAEEYVKTHNPYGPGGR